MVMLISPLYDYLVHFFIFLNYYHFGHVTFCYAVLIFVKKLFLLELFTCPLSLCRSKDTPPGTAFAGSMQLLAGVKLCTLHPITNHPHYEDKDLRERTIDVSQSQRRLCDMLLYTSISEHVKGIYA